jgi:hypothetical protein
MIDIAQKKGLLVFIYKEEWCQKEDLKK